jgi:hypothetical protein
MRFAFLDDLLLRRKSNAQSPKYNNYKETFVFFVNCKSRRFAFAVPFAVRCLFPFISSCSGARDLKSQMFRDAGSE